MLLGLCVWLVGSPWVLGFSALNLVTWNSVVVGGLMVVLVLWDFSPPSRP